MPTSLRSCIAKLALEEPALRPTLVPVLTKTAKFDFPDMVFTAVHQIHSKYETAMDAAMDKLLTRLEKALLKLDFVMDRRASYLNSYHHHEGPRFEGRIAFVDKRDHNVRSTQQIREDLEAVGIYLSNPRQDASGVWKISIGE